jgi:tetratricopeptide (TPR) repeat protein
MRFRGTFVALAAALTLAVSVAPAMAQRGGRGGDQPGKQPQLPPKWKGDAVLKGKIVDEAGKPIPGAKVTFVSAEFNSGFFAVAKKNGEFEGEDMKPGEWRVQVDAPNFTVTRQTITVAAKNAPATIVMKRDNSPELLTKAEALYKAGQNAEARTEYLTVLAAHPELTAINRAIAFTYGREKNHVEALKYLDVALVSNPNDAILLQLAAASATQVSDYPRTMAYLARIDDAMLSEPSMLSDAAVNLINKQRSTEGIQILDRVITRFPADPDAYFYRGFARMQANKNAEAKPDLEKYIALAPPSAPQVAKAKELLDSIK